LENTETVQNRGRSVANKNYFLLAGLIGLYAMHRLSQNCAQRKATKLEELMVC
jgi:hypothetical protein